MGKKYGFFKSGLEVTRIYRYWLIPNKPKTRCLTVKTESQYYVLSCPIPRHYKERNKIDQSHYITMACITIPHKKNSEREKLKTGLKHTCQLMREERFSTASLCSVLSGGVRPLLCGRLLFNKSI